MTEVNREQFEHMQPALISKKNEFHLYGYTGITEKELWEYCIHSLWRNKDVTTMRTHQIANDILAILPDSYMTYTHIEEQREVDWFSELNKEELKLLLATERK